MSKAVFKPVEDRTIIYQPYRLLMWFFFAVLAMHVVNSWTVYIQTENYASLGFLGAVQALVFWYMVNTYTARAEYHLEEEALVVIITRKFKGRRQIVLPYKDIFGVYDIKKENRKAIETGPAHYAYSRLDRRHVWVLLYNDNDSTKKVGRILMKASDEFWEAFREILPDQVCVPQAEVLGHAYAHMGQVLRREKEAPAPEEAEEEQEIVYVDEEGNEIDPKDLENSKYEIVEEDTEDTDTEDTEKKK